MQLGGNSPSPQQPMSGRFGPQPNNPFTPYGGFSASGGPLANPQGGGGFSVSGGPLARPGALPFGGAPGGNFTPGMPAGLQQAPAPISPPFQVRGGPLAAPSTAPFQVRGGPLLGPGAPNGNPSTPLPPSAFPRYSTPVQQTPAPTMPTMTPRPMLQTPAQPDQVRQQLMTALTPQPRFNV